MNTITLILMGITGIISYKGFNDTYFFNKYKFEIFSILKRNEKIRILSSGFLHGDWMHLIFNMLSLYFFNEISLTLFNAEGFLVIYFVALISGNLFSLYYYKNHPYYSAVGASGAVSGIIFSAIAVSPNGVSVNFLPGWIFATIYFGYSVYLLLNPQKNDNIGHSAHLGGALFGLLYAFITYSEAIKENLFYILIMSAPLLYLGFKLKK